MTHRAIYLFVILGLVLFLPQVSYASAPGPNPVMDIDICAPGHQPWEFSYKVVDCVESSVQAAVVTMMNALSIYMQPVVGAMLTWAVALFGIRMMGGEQGMSGKLPGFALRVAFVLFYSFNLGGLTASIFAVEKSLITLVSGGVVPWTTIDKDILGRLIGTGQGMDVSKGLIGIMGASLLSTTPAAIMGFIALSALINLLLFIFRVVFTYLLAITVMGFLLAISPFIIPLALFVQQTERFFTKWLDILISSMLVPILLFAFLTFFLNGFSFLINNVFGIMCDNPGNSTQSCTADPKNTDFSAYWQMSVDQSSWFIQSDADLNNKLIQETKAPDVGRPAVQTNINSNARRAHNFSFLTTPGINFGPSSVAMLQQLIYALGALWLFTSFMKSLVDKIPDVAYNITEANSYINMTPSGLERNIGGIFKQVQTAITGRR